jgi:site-specific DNA-methyltransferase (adenine-specific)
MARVATAGVVHHDEALNVLAQVATDSIDLVYVDPPFGTGDVQSSHGMSFKDPTDNYSAFLIDHVKQLHRVLKPTGTMYLHLDWRHVHHARSACDFVFWEKNLLNEVIWAYNFGGRGKDRWPRKHDNILVYAKNVGQHVFNWDEVDRIPYKAPDMQKVGRTPEDAAARIELGQVPTDVWDMSIVGTNSHERTGYPTQKPLKLLDRIITASSPLHGLVMDVFAGSGTTGEAAYRNGRSFVLADTSPWAIEVMQKRFKDIQVEWRL